MEQLFLQLARMALYASALVLVVIALRALLKHAPKRLVCLLWALVAFRLVCPAQIQWRASLMPPPETVVQTVREMPSLVLPAQNAPAVSPEQTENTVPTEPTPAAPERILRPHGRTAPAALRFHHKKHLTLQSTSDRLYSVDE